MTKKDQQIVSYVFGIIFIIALLALAVAFPNPTAFQYTVFRVVLSLAAAGVAAMIPGFLEVTIPNWIRAGGALAVFVVVYFFNPAAMVTSSSDISIPPLNPPIKDITPPQKTVPVKPSSRLSDKHRISGLTLVASANAENNKKYNSNKMTGLSIARLLEGSSKDQASRVFDVVISNSSAYQAMLAKFEIRWKYYHGYLSAIAQGAVLQPIAQYIVKLPIDTDDSSWKQKEEPIYPVVVLPPRTEQNPSLTTIRLQLHYFFAGRLNYHPCYDWNIIFDIAVIDTTGTRLPLFENANWRSR